MSGPKLATEQAFGGQRVGLGRIVIAWGDGARAPTAAACTHFENDEPAWSPLHRAGVEWLLRFQPNAGEIRSGEWCWPPRV